jgi:hypothetical protein
MNRMAWGSFSSSLTTAFSRSSKSPGAGEQRAHVERVDHRRLQHVRDVALDDLAGETFGDGRLAHARVAHIERVVLRAAAQDLHGAVDFRSAADQRIDPARLGLLVQIDCELLERGLALLLGLFLLGLLGALHLGRLRRDRLALADAVGDVGDRVEAAHVLLLQEIDGIALAFGEEGDQHVGAGHFIAARRLDVEDGALDDALKTAGRRRVGLALDLQRFELVVEIVADGVLELVGVDAASLHDAARVNVIDQREEKVLERRIFVAPAAGGRQRVVQRLLEFAGERRHSNHSYRPGRRISHGPLGLNVCLPTPRIKEGSQESWGRAVLPPPPRNPARSNHIPARRKKMDAGTGPAWAQKPVRLRLTS